MAFGDVLVVGKGGREDALVWNLRKSPFVKNIYVAPGNPGTGSKAENIPIEINDIHTLRQFATEKRIDLTIVGPELPLKLGIVDLFQVHGLDIFGPTQTAAKIETSKAFAKQFMLEEGIPTAPFKIFNVYTKALAYLKKCVFPLVIKVDGLADGKGAYICRNFRWACITLKAIMIERVHGHAGDLVIIEDFLQGREISVHVLCDGADTIILPAMKDHKRLKNNDKGPNTGGMSVYGPLPFVTKTDMFHVEQQVVHPILQGLVKRETVFTGCLYMNIMLTAQGPKVIECNARFGDPETQAYMGLLQADLFLRLKACTQRKLGNIPISIRNGYAICIVLCSKEYPLPYTNRFPIYGITDAEELSPDVIVFHAGTIEINRKLYTNGGRVLNVEAFGKTLLETRNLVYRACECIYFRGMQYRTDIAQDMV